MPSFRDSRAPRLVLALALAPAFWLAGCAASSAVPVAPAPIAVAPAAPPKPYVHLKRLGDDTYASRLCIREFRPASGEGPTVFLAGAVHIGEAAYYDALQKHLDAQEVVLFEGVGSDDPEAAKRRKEVRAKGSDTYSRLAKALGLVPQSDHIAYDRKHFRNADLTIEKVRRNLAEAAKQPGEAGEEARTAVLQFALVEKLVLGDNPLVGAALWMVERHPGMRAKMRFAMVAKISEAGDKESGGILSGRLEKTIIEERNDAALAALSKVMHEIPKVRSVSIFYGAAHLRDMEEKLVRDFGYRAVRSQWLTGMTVHPLAEGLSKEEVDAELGK